MRLGRAKLLQHCAPAIALSLIAVAPCAAAAQQASTSINPALPAAKVDLHREAALRIIGVLYSAEILSATLERALASTLPDALAANPQMAELETSFPGFRQKLLDVVYIDMVPLILRRLPAPWDRLTPIYMRNLSREDLDRMHEFYASETGQRLLTLMARATDYRALADKKLASGGEAPVTSADMSAIWDHSLNAALEAMSIAQLDEVIAMGDAVGNAKLERNDAEVAEARIRWANEPDPEMAALVEAKMTEIVASYAAEGLPK